MEATTGEKEWRKMDKKVERKIGDVKSGNEWTDRPERSSW